MKRISSIVLAIVMALALAACSNNTNNNNNSNGAKEVNMTAQEVLDSIKKSLGDSFDCDVTEDEARMSGYWGLDMTKVLSYSRMYNMDLQKVLQARLFVNGNYVALLILGAQGDWEASDEDQAKFAADEAAKVDAAWSGIFGSADNTIVVPEDNGNSNNFFDMNADIEG